MTDRWSAYAEPPVYDFSLKQSEKDNPGSFKLPPTPRYKESKKMKTKRQVGGDHYTKMEIEPIDFILQNSLDYCQGNVIKYVCRHETKGGVEDLRKAKHYLEFLAQEWYGEEL